jgi:Domain of unknown function (DUF4397)
MKRSAVTLVAFGALAVAAMPSVASAADQGTVRFLHAAPGAPAVDIYVNGNKAVSRLGRGKVTQYLDLAAGTYRYAIRAAGAPKRPNNIVLSGSVKVGTDKVATVAVTDRVAGPKLKVRLLSDAAERPFGAGKVRVVHYSADTPAVDVVVKGAGKVVSKLRFPNATPYLTLPEGTYTFFVRPAGTSVNAITLRNVKVEAGNNYTAWAIGALKPSHGEFGLRGAVTKDTLPARYDRTQIRVLHASPGAPNVDVYVNGAKAIPNLPFGIAAPDDGTYLKLPSGNAAVAIRPAGADPASAPVFAADLTLPPQATVTAAARGQLSNNTFTVSPYVDDVSPTSGKARVTVTHLSPNTPAVDVYANATDTSGTPAVSALPFPNASASLLVPAATYTFGVTVSGSKTVALPVGPAALPADSATTVYAIGLLGGTPALAAKALTTKL